VLSQIYGAIFHTVIIVHTMGTSGKTVGETQWPEEHYCGLIYFALSAQ